MTKLRDDRRRLARGSFATHRDDGSPVGSYTVTYQDRCVEAFDANGKCFHGEVGGPSHEPGSHTRENWWIKGPYRVDEQFDGYDFEVWDAEPDGAE